ncbi:MAG: NADH-quinone oxidoreductase subunit G [Candidatus Pelagibacter sp.]|nr:NADH-quinone oxidoreductase subunit G [Candidatus Pelagibacter sp.]OUW23501.1 MAG: NADH-quinone oxidoreductase subunit G [Rickettsiales bacterium TMED174]
MPKITVNGKEVEFEQGMTVLQACELADVEIPRFCYHERLSIAGNCRMCLVEMEKSNKPIASCAMPAAEGMKIKTNTEFVEKARKGVMEFLLANHPLDCPVCDQGGECDLQDQSLYYGVDKSRFVENKRNVKDKYMGPLIKTQMTRCIHCTRCVRFATEVAGVSELGAIGRGENTEITTYLEKSMESELSGNVIDLCPVGALTSKPYAFEARPWELKKTESIDVMDGVGSNVRVDTYGWEVKRVLPRLNENINEEWISDKTRYSCDGLLNQRIDTPYVKKNGKLEKSTWNEAVKIVVDQIKKFNPNEIGAHIGDMSNMESIYCLKKFFNNLGSNNVEFREQDRYYNTLTRQNYLFNSSIIGVEESDLILIIGSNPRHEATMLNARIRKATTQKFTKVFSFGNPGNLTYDYQVLGDKTDDIKNFIEDRSKFCEIFKKSKKPLVIIGETILELKCGGYIFEGVKEYLITNGFINNDWNALNLLHKNASSVGALDMGLFQNFSKDNNFFSKLNNREFKLLYLLGSDNLQVNKNETFVIYQGSHGDRGAETADIVLPGSAYTEQFGLFSNIEGRVQECKKASYPPGLAKEDYSILNDLNFKIFGKNIYNDFSELRNEVVKNIPNFSGFESLPNKEIQNTKKINNKFFNEEIKIKEIDYYFTNSISRSSKTMSKCREARTISKK